MTETIVLHVTTNTRRALQEEAARRARAETAQDGPLELVTLESVVHGAVITLLADLGYDIVELTTD
jgi:hypothetical protein